MATLDGSDIQLHAYDDLRKLGEDIVSIGDRVWNDGGECPQVIVPDGYSVIDLASVAEAPSRIRQTVSFNDVPSFAAYLKRFEATKQGASQQVIFGDRANKKLTAYLDYHEAADSPSWCSHIAVLLPRKTVPWQEWVDSDEKKLTQQDFAEFLDSHAPDIREPNGATLMQIVSSLEATTTSYFASTFTAQNGAKTLMYKEDVKAEALTGKIAIPEQFAIGVSIFEGDAPSIIDAKLRFRILSGHLTLFYELVRPERAEDEAFERLVKQVEGEVGQVLHGAVVK